MGAAHQGRPEHAVDDRLRFRLRSRGNLEPRDPAPPDVRFDILPRQPEARTDRRREVLGIHGTDEIGRLHNPLEAVEVGDLALGRGAEVGRFRQLPACLWTEVESECLACDRFPLRATARAAVGDRMPARRGIKNSFIFIGSPFTCYATKSTTQRKPTVAER